MALTVNMNIWVIDIKAGGNVIFNALNDLRVELVVVNWGRKAMKIWHEHIDATVGSVFVGEINHGFVCADEVSDGWFFIRANTGKNGLHFYISLYYITFCIKFQA